MGKFSKEFVDQVRDSTRLSELIGQYTVLRASGKNLMGRCPFPEHDDKSASFSVSDDKQLYHCFGCKRSGTALHFVMDIMNRSFPEAVEFLAKRAGLEIPRGADSPKVTDEARSLKELSLRAHKIAEDFFQKSLLGLQASHPAREYVENKRGLTPDLIKEFGIGYAPAGWDHLKKELQRQLRVSETQLIETGLLVRNPNNQSSYDRFRDRVMFPIRNTTGDTLGFGGRVIDDGLPKYLNSSESAIFHKGRILYGLDVNARHIRSQDEILIVEGYMDLIGLARFGVRNVAATLGTALTADHARLMQRWTKKAVLVFDGDQAGQSAMERSLPILIAAGVHARALVLPDDEDPDEWVSVNGPDAFQEKISGAGELFFIVLKRWLDGYRGQTGEKMALIDKLTPLFASMADRSLKSLYLGQVAELIGVEERWLKGALWTRIQAMAPNQPAQSDLATPSPSRDRRDKTEEMIDLKGASSIEIVVLALCLQDLACLKEFQKATAIQWIESQEILQILERATEASLQNQEDFDRFRASILAQIANPRVLVDKVFGEGKIEDAQAVDAHVERHKMLGDCIQRLKERKIKRQTAELSRQIKIDASGSAPMDEQSQRKMEEFYRLQKARLGLTKIEMVDLSPKGTDRDTTGKME